MDITCALGCRMADRSFYITGFEKLGLLVGADQSVDVAFEAVLVPTV